MSTPGAVVGVDTLSGFGQNILVRVWVQSDYLVSGKMQLLREIKRTLDKETIIPFPRYEVVASIDLTLHKSLAVTPLFKGCGKSFRLVGDIFKFSRQLTVWLKTIHFQIDDFLARLPYLIDPNCYPSLQYLAIIWDRTLFGQDAG